jgi:hypothetical protein
MNTTKTATQCVLFGTSSITVQAYFYLIATERSPYTK